MDRSVERHGQDAIMARQSKRFTAVSGFEERVAHWAASNETGFCFRGSGWGNRFGFDFVAFAGVGVHSSANEGLEAASSFIKSADDYIISHLSYDIKNRLENLESTNTDRINFAEHAVFIPIWTVLVQRDEIEIGWPEELNLELEATTLFHEICAINIEQSGQSVVSDLQRNWSKDDYLETIKSCQAHIQLGNIYQANICQEFFWEDISIHPAELFNRGFKENPNPFSVFYRQGNDYCLSWSPERFLTFFDGNVLSQPMKGTTPRGKNPDEDHAFYEQLKHSEKDRRENVMIVDMVRNDLSHFARKGSVKVPELYVIDAYPRVHQMHSTVTADLRDDANLFEVILKAFPMGSMTGAPKIRAMQIIDELESSRRGLFSGTIGFITPDKNADFNVIIRSLIYNQTSQTLSCHVGGGITALSDPEQEYEECMVKFEPIKQLMESLKAT